MRQRPGGFWRHLVEFTRAELGALLHEPGLYLFVFFILLQTMVQTLLAIGAFEAPLLLTPGLAAVGAFNTLSLLLCLLLMFFVVESLERERSAGTAAMIYSSPGGTAAYLLGKVAGNSLVVVGVLLAALVAGAVTMLIQGKVGFDIGPYALVWGALLIPTFLAWSFFLCAVQALTGNRYLTYGIALGALALTLYRQLTGRMSWVGNWMMWDTLRWSDVSVLELDRRAIVLNRLLVLALAALFLFVAVRYLRRRRVDATRLGAAAAARGRCAASSTGWRRWPPCRWRSARSSGSACCTAPAARRRRRRPRTTGSRTTRPGARRRSPSIASLDLDVTLEPATGGVASRGETRAGQPPRRAAATLRAHRRPALAGPRLDPRRRAVRARGPLAALRLRAGRWRPASASGSVSPSHGSYPGGMSKNGGDRPQFVLPGGVVLTGFGTSFVRRGSATTRTSGSTRTTATTRPSTTTTSTARRWRRCSAARARSRPGCGSTCRRTTRRTRSACSRARRSATAGGAASG